jgi:glycosyltransferase involved in cell wall biosynthesis
MKIAINTWILRNKKPDGIGFFTIHAISSLIKKHPDVKFIIYCDNGFTEKYFDFPNVEKYKIFPALRHPILYFIYLEFILPYFLNKHKPNVLIAPDGLISLNTYVKQISIIHDIYFEHQPYDLPLRNRIYYRFFFKKFAKKANRILTVSQFSKNDIIETYHIDKDKIDIVYNNQSSNFIPLSSEKIQVVKNKYSSGAPYFLFIGSLHPRKNITRLFLAFELFKSRNNCNVKLLIAGNIYWKNDEIKSIFNASKYKEDIIFLGRVTDDDLRLLLPSALCLMFVSLFEGFGVPIIEAFHSNTPVITSNTSSMPEVAGNAAILVNPFNTEEISNAMIEIYNNENLRLELIEKGNFQKLRFDWEITSNLIWKSIQKTF